MKESQFIRNYKKRKLIEILIVVCLVISLGLTINNIINMYSKAVLNPKCMKTIEDYNKAVKDEKYVSIKVQEYQEFATRQSEGGQTPIAHLIITNLDGKIFIVDIETEEYEKLEKAPIGYEVKGSLSIVPDWEKQYAIRTIENNLDGQKLDENIDNIVYPYMLTYQKPEEFIGAEMLMPIILIICIYNLIKILVKNARGLKKFKEYEGENFEVSCYKIDEEIKANSNFKLSGITISKKYIIANTVTTYFALPIEELIGTYVGVKKYHNLKKAYIVFDFRNTCRFHIKSLSKDSIDSIVRYLDKESKEYEEEETKMEETTKIKGVYTNTPEGFMSNWKSLS